jgi:hypothetical protein
MIRDDGYDLVSGWKKVRHDPVLSKIFLASFITIQPKNDQDQTS